MAVYCKHGIIVDGYDGPKPCGACERAKRGEKATAEDLARAFVEAATREGFSVDATHPSIIRITRTFSPGDADAFTACDMLAGDVLALAPLKGGSVWGTDGGGIGGGVALRTGRFVLNKSGTGARFIAAVRKVLAA